MPAVRLRLCLKQNYGSKLYHFISTALSCWLSRRELSHQPASRAALPCAPFNNHTYNISHLELVPPLGLLRLRLCQCRLGLLQPLLGGSDCSGRLVARRLGCRQLAARGVQISFALLQQV